MNIKQKSQIIIVSLLIVGLIGFAFLKPSITGHVPANINRQTLALVINESQNFLLTADNVEPYTITSFKLSGNITGNGQVKISIDTGKGQRLVVYDNIEKKKDDQGGLSSITGKATEDIEKESESDKWLIIKPIQVLLEKEVFDELADDEFLADGDFHEQCSDTCFIDMPISRDIAYRLVFLVEKNTVLKINEVVYQTKEE